MNPARRRRDDHPDEQREFEVATTPDAALIQQFFDREAGELELGELLQRVAKSPAAWREIAETQDLLDELSAPVGAPDLSERILSRLEADPQSPLHRRRIAAGWRRLGALAAAVLLGLSLVLVSSLAGRFERAPAPSLTRVLEGPQQDAELLRSLGEGLTSFRQHLGGAELRLEAQQQSAPPRLVPVTRGGVEVMPRGEIQLPERRLHWLQLGERRLRLKDAPLDADPPVRPAPDLEGATDPFI
jgi:hypothetical protein